MTKEEFRTWAENTIQWASHEQNGQAVASHLEDVKSFDPQAATLLRMYTASGEALAEYLKSRLDNH